MTPALDSEKRHSCRSWLLLVLKLQSFFFLSKYAILFWSPGSLRNRYYLFQSVLWSNNPVSHCLCQCQWSKHNQCPRSGKAQMPCSWKAEASALCCAVSKTISGLSLLLNSSIITSPPTVRQAFRTLSLLSGPHGSSSNKGVICYAGILGKWIFCIFKAFKLSDSNSPSISTVRLVSLQQSN